MNEISFGILTNGIYNDDRVNRLVNSIHSQGIPKDKYEIVLVGGYEQPEGVKYFPFDESIHPKGWITRKNNMITENSKFPVVVYLHDYFMLLPGWYDGYVQFGEDWDLCMTKIENFDGSRYRDWVTWDDPDFGPTRIIVEPWCPQGIFCAGSPVIPSYSYNKTQYLYISGAYWLAKKYVMEEFPFNESVMYAEGEDLEWFYRVRGSGKFKYVMNTLSSIKIMKPNKDRCFPEVVTE